MTRWLALLQAIVTAAVAADLAVNVIAIPWFIRLNREDRPSSAFQAVCALALAAECATAFVLTAREPAPVLVISVLAALALYKFALIVLSP
jgi:hypothetical protein